MNNKKQLDFQTIAVDFDGTLCYSKWPELGQPNQALIEYLQVFLFFRDYSFFTAPLLKEECGIDNHLILHN